MKFKKGNIPWNKANMKVNCDYCKKEVDKHPYNIKKHKHHFCNQQCHYKWKTGKLNIKASETRKRLFKEGKLDVWNKGITGYFTSWKGRYHTKETLKKMSLKKRGKNHPNYGKHHSEEAIRKMSEKHKSNWSNPRHIKKMIQSFQIKPTKPESQLISLLKRNIPEFRYNGDFSQGISIGRRIPDFVNCDGKKQVIEIFGKYWHSPLLNKKVSWKRTSKGTMEHYKKYGFDCLILWDYELKKLSEQQIVERIKGWDSSG